MTNRRRSSTELAAGGTNVSAFLSRLQTAIDQRKKEERLSWQQDAQKKRERFARTQERSLRSLT